MAEPTLTVFKTLSKRYGDARSKAAIDAKIDWAYDKGRIKVPPYITYTLL